MANNGKRPRNEPPRHFTDFRTFGPIRRQRLPSEEQSDLEYELGSSSAEDDEGWTTADSESLTESMELELYEEEMMLLEEEEEAEEEMSEDEMNLIGFSSDEDSEYDEAMDRELARVEKGMVGKNQGFKPNGTDWMSCEDEDAWQFLEDEWMCEQEQILADSKQNQQKAKAPSEDPDWDALDAINWRFLVRGNVNKKPCTMTSSVGVRRSRISMMGMIVPAKEMLRNFFRDCRRSDAVKENFGGARTAKGDRMGGSVRGSVICQRKALTERNL